MDETEKTYQEDIPGQLPPGGLVEDPQLEQLSKFIAGKLLEVSDNQKPEMFSREDILGNIQGWEKQKLMRLHQLQKACTRLGLKDATQYFQKEEKKILGFSRSVGGFQQKIIRSTLGDSSMSVQDKKKTFDFMPKWKWNR